MAGDWIPNCKNLSRKPEVLAISAATGRTRREVHSILLDFWSWADSETTDGTLPGLTLASLADACGEDERFWLAVIQVGWLRVGPEGVTLPNFERWNTKPAKQRLLNTRHKQLTRNDGDLSRFNRDKITTTEQNSTEHKEIQNPPTPHSGECGVKEILPELQPTQKQGGLKTVHDLGEQAGCAAKESSRTALGKSGSLAVEDFVSAWNAVPQFVHVRGVIGPRLRHFRARIRDPDWLKDWRVALEKAALSPFCCGGGSQGWRATADWFLRPDTVTKILEGIYDRNEKSSVKKPRPLTAAELTASYKEGRAKSSQTGTPPGASDTAPSSVSTPKPTG